MKKIFILLGHPNSNGTFNDAIADAYETAAKAAGHEVKRTNIGDLAFDPILHEGYKTIQDLEPDLKQVQEDIKWADHFVLVYPVWWSSMPALLKGMIDRMWLPAFAYRFIKTKDGKNTIGWQKLMKGKSARVIATLKNHALLERFMFGDYSSEIVDAVLRFSGFKTRLTEIGMVEALSDAARANRLARVATLGRKGA